MKYSKSIYTDGIRLVFMAWQPDLRAVLWVAVPAIIIPMVVYHFASRMGKTREVKLEEDEISFNEKFPAK